MQEEDKNKTTSSEELDAKICALCKKTKGKDDFYKKGRRVDSRCKSCVKSTKLENYRNGHKRLCAQDFDQYSQKYREEHGYPRFESHNDCPVIIDVVYVPVANTYVSAGRILELYHKDISVEEIAKLVARKPRFISKTLRKIGIGSIQKEKRPIDLKGTPTPYGWNVRYGRLVPHRGEQWVLEKIETEMRADVSSSVIASNLNSARVKPRYVRKWIPQLVEHVTKENRKMKQAILKKGN